MSDNVKQVRLQPRLERVETVRRDDMRRWTATAGVACVRWQVNLWYDPSKTRTISEHFRFICLKKQYHMNI